MTVRLIVVARGLTLIPLDNSASDIHRFNHIQLALQSQPIHDFSVSLLSKHAMFSRSFQFDLSLVANGCCLHEPVSLFSEDRSYLHRTGAH